MEQKKATFSPQSSLHSALPAQSRNRAEEKITWQQQSPSKEEGAAAVRLSRLKLNLRPRRSPSAAKSRLARRLPFLPEAEREGSTDVWNEGRWEVQAES